MNDCGKIVCAWCQKDVRPAPELKTGEVSHGICPACFDIEYERLTKDRGAKDETNRRQK